MLEFIRNITSRRTEDGASAVEYGLLVAGIAALIVAIVFLFGGVIKNSFDSTCKTIKGNGTAAATCN
jgi:pilus assembly protein Flp/PilA